MKPGVEINMKNGVREKWDGVREKWEDTVLTTTLQYFYSDPGALDASH